MLPHTRCAQQVLNWCTLTCASSQTLVPLGAVNGMAGAAECVSGARDATCARLIATTLISMFGAGSATGRSKFVRPAAVACSRSLRLLCNEPCKRRLFLRAQTSGCSGSVGCVRGARAYLGPLFCTSLSRVRHTYQHHPFYEHTLEYPKIDRSVPDWMCVALRV